MKKLFSSEIFLIFFVVIILILVIFLHSNGILKPIERFIYDLLLPIEKFFKIIINKISDFFGLIGSIKNIARENRLLKEENSRLLSDISGLQGIKDENDILRRELNLLPRKKFNLVPAFVVFFDQSGAAKGFTIDKGEKDGVKKGMPVIVSNGILVGRVSEVTKNGAEILLIIDNQSRIDANISGKNASGVVIGKYGLGLSMENIPQDISIEKGDLVVTSSKSGIFPSDLVIGKISEVHSNPNEVFQSADIIPEASFPALRVVSVILSFSL